MSEKQTERRAQIEAAAFELLENVGYKKASMLEIAKRARASNETLYAWYGNKQALFSSLISSNARIVEDSLQEAVSGNANPDDALFDLGKLLLEFTATEKAIIINRAAVADVQETGLLAAAVEKNARQVMIGLIDALMAKLAASGRFRFDHGLREATEVFIGLLIGELQMQQALGAIPPLASHEIDDRAKRITDLFFRLYRFS
ncbi:transcriptional regulator, TetR family [Paracoccus halophilus]|uniref:Transcriptional regulator, TetR family n=1 Tax=Paracoccus halophilus TaxID=376733 RepID=A0A099EWP6_9RHOB|nr:TetR/AcrR family transcriptional regulator [Paracoccus halophilus]KGJ02845.1 hypothetical protein IT41_16220 [Paracoccus halophilus]SFA60206.1 transcriptional regulator, TetR family [Paracoccus halophilus]